MTELNDNRKSPLESKGVLGGILGTAGFGILALILSLIGIKVSPGELDEIKNQSAAVLVHADVIKTTLWPALGAFLASAISIVGNIRRKTRIAWSARNGKNPFLSNGVLGGAAGILLGIAGVFTEIYQAVSSEDVAALIETGKTLYLQGKDIVILVTPLVIALVGNIMAIVGRWQAKEKIR